jgi:glycosyltransferase involved in cell wall biosynthesis
MSWLKINMSSKVNSRKKQTLIVGPLPPPYHGVAVMIKLLIEGLRTRNGFDFLHLNTRDPKKRKNFGTFTLRNSWFAIKFIFQLLRYLMREPIEVVYIPISQNFWGFARDSSFILTSGLLFRRKVIIHLHGGYFKTFFNKGSWLRKKYIKFVFKYVDRGIVLGHCLRYLLEDVLPEDKIDVVYNGVDMNSFDRIQDRREKNGKFNILFTGVLEESKGFFDLIKAIPKVSRYHPDIGVFILGRWGDDDLKNRVTSYIRENNLQDKIKFWGVISEEEKIKLFKSSDVFVLPTYFHLEGQPGVILEAMATGLPVITCDRGSIKEMITHGENGFIVPPSSPNRIAEKITVLIEDKNLKEKMGRNGRRRVKEKFTLNHYVDGVAGVIEKSING